MLLVLIGAFLRDTVRAVTPPRELLHPHGAKPIALFVHIGKTGSSTMWAVLTSMQSSSLAPGLTAEGPLTARAGKVNRSRAHPATLSLPTEPADTDCYTDANITHPEQPADTDANMTSNNMDSWLGTAEVGCGFPFGACSFTSRPCRYFTILREPISRLISAYNYFC